MAEAANREELFQHLASSAQPQVIVLAPSIYNADCAELINTLKQSYPANLILVFSHIDREEHVIQMMVSGASGYLLKSISTDEMVFAIRHIKAGGRYLCAEISQKLLESVAAHKSHKPFFSNIALSKRELEVLALIADGLTNNEIAAKLFTSRRTVEGHRKNLIEKVGAHNTATLIRYAVKHGLVE